LIAARFIQPRFCIAKRARSSDLSVIGGSSWNIEFDVLVWR